VRISYIAEKGSLKVSYDVKNNNYFQLCFEVSDLQLPNGYFFGLTAHTGDVADNHDIYHFHTRLLSAEHSVSALHSDLKAPVYVQSNQETDETKEQGTEEVEQSVAERYHSSVLMWHALSAKEKKSLRGEHVRDVSFPHTQLVTHLNRCRVFSSSGSTMKRRIRKLAGAPKNQLAVITEAKLCCWCDRRHRL
jgi:hypothetical protein